MPSNLIASRACPSVSVAQRQGSQAWELRQKAHKRSQQLLAILCAVVASDCMAPRP